MKLELEFMRSFCSTEKFSINGIDAGYEDFGYKGDQSPEDAEDYSCGDMKFIRIAPTAEVLKKYGISGPEYELIAGSLEAGLSFGCCGLCQ